MSDGRPWSVLGLSSQPVTLGFIVSCGGSFVAGGEIRFMSALDGYGEWSVTSSPPVWPLDQEWLADQCGQSLSRLWGSVGFTEQCTIVMNDSAFVIRLGPLSNDTTGATFVFERYGNVGDVLYGRYEVREPGGAYTSADVKVFRMAK
jgi:hypothetical protein